MIQPYKEIKDMKILRYRSDGDASYGILDDDGASANWPAALSRAWIRAGLSPI